MLLLTWVLFGLKGIYKKLTPKYITFESGAAMPNSEAALDVFIHMHERYADAKSIARITRFTRLNLMPTLYSFPRSFQPQNISILLYSCRVSHYIFQSHSFCSLPHILHKIDVSLLYSHSSPWNGITQKKKLFWNT